MKYDLRISFAKTRRLPYRCYITSDDGRTVTSKSHPSRTETETWAADELYRLRNPQSEHIAQRGLALTFGQMVDAYLADDEVEGCKNLTMQAQQDALWWRDHFPETALTNLVKDDIRQALKAYLAGGRKPSSRNRKLASVRRVLRYCVARDWMSCGPRDTIAHQITNLPENNERKRGITQDEVGQLLAVCRDCEWDRMYLFILGLATTGARKMEWLAMEWDRVNLDAGTAYIPRTKNGKDKTLALTPAVVEELSRVRTEAERFRGGLVFPSPIDQDRPIDHRRYWESARAAIGYGGKMGDDNYLRLHDLRHTVGSYLASKGFDAFAIRDYLGHKNLASTNRYVHEDNDKKREVAHSAFGAVGVSS
jgi:integrase